MWQYEYCGLATPSHNFKLSPEVYMSAIHPICTYAPQNDRLSEQIFNKFNKLAIIDSGTKPIKNKGSKKNGLVIGQATKDICFKYRYNIKIMMTVSGHTIL